MFMMLGYDGEEERDLEASVEHLKKSSPDIFLTTVAYPIRGTAYYEQVRDRIRSDQPWAGRTDRDLRIEGRRSRRYYDHATKWMVNEVNLDRAWRQGSRNLLRLGRLYLAARRGRIGMWLHRHESETDGMAQPSGRGWGESELQSRERAG
jgi:radical SAM superfamily enzyme YgiQ (UPF0313 family)